MKFNSLFVILFCFLINGYSQTVQNIYLDEINQIIPYQRFKQKVSSKVYTSTKFYDKDNAYHKLDFAYYMGKLDSERKGQLFLLLSQRINVDTSKTIVIHYRDTLKALSSYPKYDSIIKLPDGKHRHLGSHRRFIKEHLSCIQSHRGKETQLYHFFEVNEGHPLTFEEIKWFQDPSGTVKKVFQSKFSQSTYWFLVIHPNGDFAVRNNISASLNDKWNHFLKHKKWEKYLQRFLEEYYYLNPKIAKEQGKL